MAAGRRDTLIELQRFATTQDEYGEEIQSWAPLAQEKAAIYWGRGDERRQAAAEQGSQAATFAIVANEVTRTVTVRDRIMLEGTAWDIQSVTLLARKHVEITATRSV